MEKIESKLYCALVSREWKEAGDILSGERELLKQLLSKKLDLLQRAIRNIAPTEIIMQLISPQNICMQDYYGNTALHEAVKKRRWDLVPVLLQHGADVNSTGCLDKTPLHWAAHHGAPADIITQLMSPHNINMQATNGSTALHEAVKERRWELVPALLQHGADVDLSDRGNKIPLHWAAHYQAPTDIITQLISPHNINMQDKKYGNTALIEAVREENWELVPVLLQRGADVNMDNYRNQTPLYWAVFYGAPADIITKLISPQNINMQDTVGKTALHWAARCERSWELVPVLLQNGADVNLCDNKYNTELYRVLDVGNRTPLHHAVFHGAPADIVTQLISPHNINIQNKDGDTALHNAVTKGRWEMVPVLLQHGSDPSLLDSPQPGQPLVLSLQALCIASIRCHMPVKSDAAYEGLGLPEILVSDVKLRPQAEDIVKRAKESVP